MRLNPKNPKKSYLLLLTPLWGWPISLVPHPRWSHMEDFSMPYRRITIHVGPYGSSWKGLGRLRKLSVNFP